MVHDSFDGLPVSEGEDVELKRWPVLMAQAILPEALESLRRPLAAIRPDPTNPKQHTKEQVDAIAASFLEFGQDQPIVVDKDGVIAKGEGRYLAAQALNWEDAAVLTVADDELKRIRRNLADNRTHEMTGYDDEMLLRLLQQVSRDDMGGNVPGYDEQAIDELMGSLHLLADDEHGLAGGDAARQAKPDPRNLPLDMIFTIGSGRPMCCLAVRAGLKYGFQSTAKLICLYHQGMRGHEITFIDNDYFNYDHAAHAAAVAQYRPKYATVRDVMTREQCQEDGIPYFPLPQILDWADELAAKADDVIVIPKYDCLDKIPDRYVLGYSIPTSHGQTPLPAAAFKGRRVHLLGGSWKLQLAFMAELGDDVVSVDNNYIMKTAAYGNFVRPDGETQSLAQIGLGSLTNPLYVALAISLGSIGAKVNELYPQAPQPELEEETT